MCKEALRIFICAANNEWNCDLAVYNLIVSLWADEAEIEITYIDSWEYCKAGCEKSDSFHLIFPIY